MLRVMGERQRRTDAQVLAGLETEADAPLSRHELLDRGDAVKGLTCELGVAVDRVARAVRIDRRARIERACAPAVREGVEELRVVAPFGVVTRAEREVEEELDAARGVFVRDHLGADHETGYGPGADVLLRKAVVLEQRVRGGHEQRAIQAGIRLRVREAPRDRRAEREPMNAAADPLVVDLHDLACGHSPAKVERPGGAGRVSFLIEGGPPQRELHIAQTAPRRQRLLRHVEQVLGVFAQGLPVRSQDEAAVHDHVALARRDRADGGVDRDAVGVPTIPREADLLGVVDHDRDFQRELKVVKQAEPEPRRHRLSHPLNTQLFGEHQRADARWGAVTGVKRERRIAHELSGDLRAPQRAVIRDVCGHIERIVAVCGVHHVRQDRCRRRTGR